MTTSRIAILGASGLIGQAVAGGLTSAGFPILSIARRFTAAQRHQFGTNAREVPLVNLGSDALGVLLGDCDVVVNCIGVLQDGAMDSTRAVHEEFVERLISAIRRSPQKVLLIHVSMPGDAADDNTAFSTSKRRAERMIAESGLSYVILRPGFVFASAAYGGSAMLRALATLPFDLPPSLAARPFQTVDVDDITATVTHLVRHWRSNHDSLSVTLDLLSPPGETLGGVLAQLRGWLGHAPDWRVAVPILLVKAGALAGDAVSWLGWRPPMRSTALKELQRGVSGDPAAWQAATGIFPRSFSETLRKRPPNIQEKWFARLYLMKAVLLAGLVVFWCASAAIALGPAYADAVGILTSRGFPATHAQAMTIAGSTMDFSVGLAIAFRRTSRWGLRAGIAVSLFYMLAAAVLTPDLWVEPLGALVKTFPAIVLMMVGLGMADER
nr:SDR family oxidoreductase [Pseudolabrys sp. FHR47]